MASYVTAALEALEQADFETDYKMTFVRGIGQNPTFEAGAFENVIDTFETRDGDCFIATFVKAGTTWTQQIVHTLLRQGEPGGHYVDSVPW